MKYLTKEWYQLMQKTSLHLNFQESEQAAIFSEEFFQTLLDAKLQELLELEQEMEKTKFDDLYPVECPYQQVQKYYTLDENGNQLWETQVLSEEEYVQVKANYFKERERMRSEWKPHIFDSEKTKQKLDFYLTQSIQRWKKVLPPEILNKVADIRVLALNVATPEIIAEITAFCKENEKKVQAISKQYYTYLAEYKKQPGREFVQELNFHDCDILSMEWENSHLRIQLDNTSGFTNRNIIYLQNANIVKCDGNWKNAWWLYEEIYDTDRGFELHILLRQQMRNPKDAAENLMELTIQAEDIMFN